MDIQVVKNFRLSLKSPYDPKIPAIVGTVSGRVWDADRKIWTVPISSVRQLADKMVREKVWNEGDANAVIELVGKITDYNSSDISAVEKAVELPLRSYQKETLKFFINRGSALGALDLGTGKAQPVDSPVLTPKGFRPIGELKVDDDIIGIDGKNHKVIGVFPQGKKMIYEVMFSDRCNTRCCEDHLWTVRTSTMRRRYKNEYTVIKLKDLIHDLTYKYYKDGRKDKYGKTSFNKWFIPMTNEVEFSPSAPLPIHPYLLGILLGDGCLRHYNKGNPAPSFTTKEDEIVKNVEKLLPNGLTIIKLKNYGMIKTKTGMRESLASSYRISSGSWKGHHLPPRKGKRNILLNKEMLTITEQLQPEVECKNYITAKLKELKLYGLGSLDKFIPEIYKLSSVENRKALIRGLIDTDGFISKRGKAEYYSSSKRMIEDVQFIIESLGGSATLSQRIPKYNYKNKTQKGAIAYRLFIRLPNNGFIPATLTRKVENYKKNKFYWDAHRAITSIKPIGESEAVCISTSAPCELYLTDHCIVTHNTMVSLSYLYDLKKKGKIEKALFVVPLSVIWHWRKEGIKFFGPKLKMCIIGYEIDKTGKIKKLNKEDRRAQLLSTEYDGYILNYEKLPLIVKDPEVNALWNRDHRFLIVADEITSIKNYDAQRTKNLKSIAATYRIGLSGRPIENNLFEFYTILDWIWPRCLGTWGQFKDKFIITDQWGNIIKTKEQQTLKEIARYIAIQYSRYQVMKELPPLSVNQYDVELSREEEQDYQKIADAINDAIEALSAAEKKEGIINILALFGMSRMFCDHPILVRMSESPSAKALGIVCGRSSKMEELRIILDEILGANKEKVVVFSQYEKMLDLLEVDIKKNHPLVKIYKYSGGISATKRFGLIEDFNKDNNPAVFLSTDSAAYGVELQTASYIVNYDLPWNPAKLDQRIARLHRSGQKQPVIAINMVVRGADKVEERVLEIIRKKEKIYKDIFDGADTNDKV